jgi:hypothetical protein
MAKAKTQADTANTNETTTVTDPTEVAALAAAETIAEVIERYGMTQEDFDALPEASREALVKAHLAEKEAQVKEAELAAREARVAKAEEALTTATAGRFYDPALDDGKSDEEKLAKYAGVIKSLLSGEAHPMFTIVATHNVDKNQTVQAVVDLPRGTRYQNRDEQLTLCAFNERAFVNNPADLPEDDISLQRGTALRQTA